MTSSGLGCRPFPERSEAILSGYTLWVCCPGLADPTSQHPAALRSPSSGRALSPFLLCGGDEASEPRHGGKTPWLAGQWRADCPGLAREVGLGCTRGSPSWPWLSAHLLGFSVALVRPDIPGGVLWDGGLRSGLLHVGMLAARSCVPKQPLSCPAHWLPPMALSVPVKKVVGGSGVDGVPTCDPEP